MTPEQIETALVLLYKKLTLLDMKTKGSSKSQSYESWLRDLMDEIRKATP